MISFSESSEFVLEEIKFNVNLDENNTKTTEKNASAVF
jgi:hypothetical protein